MIDHEVLRATPVSGAVTVTSRRQIAGKIIGVHINTTGQAATLDIDIHTKGNDGVVIPILVRPNSNADGYYAPRSATHLATDATVIAGGSAEMAIVDQVEMVIAQGTDVASGVVATIIYES